MTLEVCRRNDIRNIAVIAHVDHGKTTLVDSMLRQCGLLRQTGEEAERVMDSFELERERGITILAKNTALYYGKTKINILDTPGHHDFGGEVERTLIMADGVLLLVDAAEGPLPQTRFVLAKALQLKLPVVVAINKIDRKDARPSEVLGEVYDLFIDLGADDEQIGFPVIYTNGRRGIALENLEDESGDLQPLFNALIAHIPGPEDRREEQLCIHVNNLGWDDYVGRLIIGRVLAGEIHTGQTLYLHGATGAPREARVLRLYMARGLERREVELASAGDIVSIAGVEDVAIGDTLTQFPDGTPLKRIKVDEPTMAMLFCVNTSPFAGQDGRYVTSRNLHERLFRETAINVAIQVEQTGAPDVFRVVGRGELQLGILVETMRREGYELMLSRPEVVTKEIDGELCEPVERLVVDCDNEMVGAVNELLGPRKSRLMDMSVSGDRTRIVFLIPTRGLIGLHSHFLTETRGTGVMNSIFDSWIPWQGPIPARRTGVLVADRVGNTTPYALFHLQPRGTLFVDPGTRVYEGMVIGENSRPHDINVNPCREKKLTNIRAAAKDENVILSPPRKHGLEEAIEFIDEDEFVEVTPHYVRIRKKILSANLRHRG